MIEHHRVWIRSVSCAVSVLALVTAQHAAAQDPAAPAPTPPRSTTSNSSPVPEVVITGTQLRGVAPVGSRVIALSPEQMQQTGMATTADILKTIPQITSLGPTEGTIGTNVNSATLNTTRANGVNLRGLGSQATLTLIDGRRAPPGGIAGQLFDASVIPAIALERIEVVADGASATYGSDAVAGVVNLILRKDFEGAEVRGRYGLADNYNEQQLSGIVGQRWEGGSVMAAAEYYRHSSLQQEDRSELFPCDLTSFGGVNSCSFNASPGNVTDPSTGTRYGLPSGSGVGLTPADLSTTPNRRQNYVGNDVLPQTERWNVVSRFDQEISSDLAFWASGYYTRRVSTQRSGPITIGSATPVPSSNPFFIPFFAGQTQEVVEYSLYDDYGPAIGRSIEKSYQIAAGLDYNFADTWRASFYGSHGITDGSSNTFGSLNTALLTAALADSNPATALNPFGSGGNNTYDQVAALVSFFKPTGHYKVDLLNLKADGELFTLPGGPVRLAVGSEFHHDYYLNEAFENGSTASLSDVNLFGHADSGRNVWSGFAEANVPIVGDDNAMPGLMRLEFNAAVRYDHYSDVGSTTNPKFAMRYDPVDGLSLRASYGTSFRAPTLSDANPASTATVFQLPNFGPFGNVLEQVGGNAGVKPETATTWSVGAKVSPPDSGFNASVDYFNIDYRNVIDTAPVFSPQVFTDPGYAPFVILNPTVAQVNALYALPWAPPPIIAATDVDAIVDARRNNIGRFVLDGLDFSADYQFALGGGTLQTGFTGTYLFTYKRAFAPGATPVDRLNRVNFPIKFRARANVGWSNEQFNAIAFLNYVNSYQNTIGTIAPNQPVGSYTTVDLSLGYNLGMTGGLLSDVGVSVNVLNVFDANPPFAAVSPTQVYDSTIANPIGRMIAFTVRKGF
jgi:iron complex outermembrane recepter protein